MKSWLMLFKEEPLKALASLPLAGWLFLTAVGAILICLIGGPLSSAEAPPAGVAEGPSSLDTFIPEGFVLIPIQLENYDSLDSILGSYGVVDLYLAGQDESLKARPLVRRIKILRAPQNPSQFAVLVPQSQASTFFRGDSMFFAAIQNPKQGGTRFENSSSHNPQARSRKVLVFEQEDP